MADTGVNRVEEIDRIAWRKTYAEGGNSARSRVVGHALRSLRDAAG